MTSRLPCPRPDRSARRPQRTGALAALVLLAACAAAPARADAAALWNGGSDYNFADRLLASAFDGRLRIGAEAELGRFPTALLGPAIPVNTWMLRGVLRIVPFPRSVSPYAGLSLGLHGIEFEGDAIESTLSTRQIDAFGLDTAGTGFLGLQLPIGLSAALFGETRAAFDLGVQNSANVLVPERQDGVSALVGVRVGF